MALAVMSCHWPMRRRYRMQWRSADLRQFSSHRLPHHLWGILAARSLFLRALWTAAYLASGFLDFLHSRPPCFKQVEHRKCNVRQGGRQRATASQSRLFLKVVSGEMMIGIPSVVSMICIEARRKSASAFRLRFSQSSGETPAPPRAMRTFVRRPTASGGRQILLRDRNA